MLIGFGRRQLAGNKEDDGAALTAMGCTRAFIYETSHELSDRFEELLDFAREGDVVALIDIDRLGRSIQQVLGAVSQLSERGLRVHVRDTAIAPGTAVGDSFAAICDVLRVIEPEAAISERARRRGRPSVLDGDTQEKALRMLSGNASVLEVARLLRVSPATIYRYFPRRGRPSRGRDAT